jgi:hypothetical protein
VGWIEGAAHREVAGEGIRLGDEQGSMEKKKSAWSPCRARDDEEELVDDSLAPAA